MKNILVISGHPDLKASIANRTIIDELGKEVSNISVRRLDTLYPDYKFDIPAEQQALVDADVIVLQFPFYWYSFPGLLKKYIDDIFVHGFAHGSTGDKLQGKKLVLSFTTGAPTVAYTVDGPMHHTVEQFLPPMQQLAALCGMEYVEPIYSNGMIYIPGVHDEAAKAEIIHTASAHAHKLAAVLTSL